MTGHVYGGLTGYVLRSPILGDCTNGGISATHDLLTVVGVIPYGETAVNTLVGPSLPSEESPAVAVEVAAGFFVRTLRIVPVIWDEAANEWVKAPGWYMAGGNFLSVGDSRLGELIERIIGSSFYGAYSIHDRQEAWRS